MSTTEKVLALAFKMRSSAIADEVGVSKQRVCQIFKAHGIDNAGHFRKLMAKQCVKKRADEMEKRRNRFLPFSGCTVQERAKYKKFAPAFKEKKLNSHKQGIEFKLTLPQFAKIWGRKFKRKGRGYGACMMRKNHEGAYEMGNVIISTCDESSRLARYKER